MYLLSSPTTTAGNSDQLNSDQLKLTHSHSHSSPFSFPRMVSPESCSERKTVSTSTRPINAHPPGLLRVVSDSDVNEQLQVNNTNNHLNHSRRHRRQSSSIAMMIRPQDIICGRDSKAFNHPGNRQFRSFIAGHLTEYNAATSRTERGIVIQQVLYMVQNELGARFVKKQQGSSSSDDGYSYVEISAKEAREKVGHSLRDKSVFRNQQQRQQPTGCRIVDNKCQKKKKNSKKKAVTSPSQPRPDPVTSLSSSLPSSTTTTSSSTVPTHQSTGTFLPSTTTSSNSKSLAEEFFHATSPLDFLPINHTQQDLSQLESLENLLDFEETSFAAGFDDIDMIAAEQSSAHEGDDLNVDNHHYDCGI